jgi:hypothetical protein
MESLFEPYVSNKKNIEVQIKDLAAEYCKTNVTINDLLLEQIRKIIPHATVGGAEEPISLGSWGLCEGGQGILCAQRDHKYTTQHENITRTEFREVEIFKKISKDIGCTLDELIYIFCLAAYAWNIPQKSNYLGMVKEIPEIV